MALPLVARIAEILTFNLDVCTAPPCVQNGDTVYFISVVESLKKLVKYVPTVSSDGQVRKKGVINGVLE